MALGETRADMPAAPRTLQNVEGYGSASRHGPLGGSASQIAPARRGVSAVVVKCRIDTANTWGSDPHCRARDNVVWRRGNRPAPPTDVLGRAWGYITTSGHTAALPPTTRHVRRHQALLSTFTSLFSPTFCWYVFFSTVYIVFLLLITDCSV